MTAGTSAELLLPDMLIGNYGNSVTRYGLGDFGTPGTAGNYQFDVTSVPESSSIWLALAGSVLLLKRKKKT